MTGELTNSGVSRRSFVVGGLVALAATGPLAKCGPGTPHPMPDLSGPPFTLGVASGDPRPDGVVLWSRLAPDPLVTGGGMPAVPVPVSWEVATDPDFVAIVASGRGLAPPQFAHSIHADATGLAADTWYWYRFHAGPWTSPVGRTRTTPAVGAPVESLRLGVATCQHWARGYYTAHQNLALEDLDAVVFVGDYIYEANASGGPRAHGTPTATTLDDYRNRYALYKTDPHLQASHAAFPWLTAWDDHEVVNNYAGTADASGVSTAAFLARRAAAYQAWWEHMPAIPRGNVWSNLDIHQTLVWGDLARLALLDARQHRTPYQCGSGLAPLCAEQAADDVTMLGAAQEAWLASTLAETPATWHFVAQQSAFAALNPTPVGTFVNLDQWDGYPAARERLLALLESEAVTNPVVLSGDIHCAMAVDIHRDGDVTTPRIGTELMTTSVSSTFTAVPPVLFESVLLSRPAVRHANATNRGYLVCDVTHGQVDASFRIVDALAPSSTVTTDAVISIPATPAGA
jgi:alkaline phosphatase D